MPPGRSSASPTTASCSWAAPTPTARSPSGARNGVDVVRLFALWSRIEGKGGGYSWHSLDQAVQRVRGAGLKVMLTVSGPGPGGPVRPDKRRFAAFAGAVASRYGADVDRYIIWNEPNLPSWLQPQAKCTRRGCTPVAPHLYRGLVRAAYPAIRAADPGARGADRDDVLARA